MMYSNINYIITPSGQILGTPAQGGESRSISLVLAQLNDINGCI